MTDKSQKIAKILLAAGGTAVGVFLIAKYHKTIISKFRRAKNVVLYDYAKLKRSNFTIEVINTSGECDTIIESLRQHCIDFPVLGFDCEWVTVNNERRKVALIQLCSSQGLCALIRVCKFSKIPLELRKILEDPDIIKTGVTPSNDAKLLLQDYAISMNGTFDLRFLAVLTNHRADATGLARLSKAILNIELDKDWHVRCSDWENEHLNPKQLDYAAKDAFVAIEIFRKLYNSIRATSNDPDSIRKFCDNYTDITFKNKLAQMNLDPAGSETFSEKKLLKMQNKASKSLRRNMATRAGPFYDNCCLQAPDGDLLCTIDRKKAEWYLTKGLGTEVPDEPVYTVRLKFEPAGRAVGETGDFYKTPRENRCVVCGKTEELLRKNIVPHEYRKFFPTVMKDSASHDVVLLCWKCHQMSNICDLSMRQKLKIQCDAPLDGIVPSDKRSAIQKLSNEQKLAKPLIIGKNIPETRKEELRSKLAEAYPDQEISEEFLKNLLSKEVPNLSSILGPSHGELVVQRFKHTNGLVELEKLWRNHFLTSLDPKFMPDLWDINHNENRLKIRASEGRIEEEDLKFAGVDAVIIPKKQPVLTVTSPENREKNVTVSEADDVDNSSEWEYQSAAGSINSSKKFDPDRTLTEDDRYFSDTTSMASFYETIKSDGSTLDDFQSFASSLTERPSIYDSDEKSSLGSQQSLNDTDTEVEEDPSKQMEM